MNILGLSCFYHDSAACLVKDGRIIAAAQEERFTRKKHDPDFPTQAVKYCLAEAKIKIEEVDLVVFYDKPFLKFERLLETYLDYAPYGFRSFLKAVPVWVKRKLWLSIVIKKELGYNGKVLYTEHHQAHAASAFFPSPFKEAAVLTVDGVGEWATTSWGVGRGNELVIKEELNFPHSLGLLYSAFTYYLGFKVNSGEYKVMGLAPYGEPKYVDLIRKHLVKVKADGSFKLDMSYFNYPAGLTMTNRKFHQLFGGEPRQPESDLTQREMDLAASLQVVTEELMLGLARYVKDKSGLKYLCLAGGVALNCVANGQILRSGLFEDIWIQPAAGDAGGALGAALATWYQYLNKPREVNNQTDLQQASLLGPSWSNDELKKFLDENSIPCHFYPDGQIYTEVAKAINDGRVIGLFRGRMEFGPRALGNRSIIGDARNQEMQSKMNLKIKFRESFRPFAPSVLREQANEYFELSSHQSPYMLLTALVREKHRLPDQAQNLWGIEKLKQVRSTIPAVTHVDYSARVQTVDKDAHSDYHRLISAFYELSGCPVIINTSFNVRGEPIVGSPTDAYRCFRRTEMDILVLGDFIISKEDKLPDFADTAWQKEFTLD
ncbi:MAG: carbamoyltransferase [Candidatus Pacebacteria bacterium]|nr:carbamoyltransferase [Candidatus Paceibacterota bacterium]